MKRGDTTPNSKSHPDSIKLSPAQIRIQDVLKYGKRAAGRANYLRYLRGGRLSASQSIVAHCYLCEGDAGDGTYDCEDICCPLYPWHPYKTVNPARLPNRAIPEKNGKGLVCLDVAKTGNTQRNADGA
jgi:hypothetical protein